MSALDGSDRRLLAPGVEGGARLVGDVLVRAHAGVLTGQTLNLSDMTLAGAPFSITGNIGTNAFAGGPAGVLTYVPGGHAVERQATVIQRVLRHVGLSTDVPEPRPAPGTTPPLDVTDDRSHETPEFDIVW